MTEETQAEMTEVNFQVVQVYASMKYWRRGEKIARPLPLGTYPAQTETQALRKAADDWKLPTQLLFATIK